MSKDVQQEDEHGGLPSSGGTAARGDSDLDDSFLRELRQDEPLPWFPVPGEWLGGVDGRRYHILDWMGGGGMGQVFRARDEVLRREVALKFILSRQGFDEQVLREARAIALLDHEHIVRIFDVSEWSESPGGPRVPFLVMECLEGESLASLLERGQLEVRRALEVLDGIAAGLAHAHERHLVHRDLKPSNVFLTPQGTVKLLDFGLSHLTPDCIASRPRLSTGGTPAYMAPEQWRGEPQDARTDMWAVGVVLYEMLAGRLPFPGATWSELRERVTSEESVRPVRTHQPEVPEEVESLVAMLLAKEPARRLPNARELREALHELRERLPGPRVEASAPPSVQRRQLVLLCCQLTDLAGGAERLEAEDLEEQEAAFHRGCSELLQRHGGTVHLAMGGEVLASFGYPQVREEDAERAVRTALRLAQELPGARVGLHTDRVLLDARVLQGGAPKVVSWLASQGGPGEVLASETTWRQVRGAFEMEALGPRDVPGRTGTAHLALHRVLRERETRVRFERTLMAGGLTPLVGREGELRRLLALWDAAREGRGACVLLRGEAGIGKSRLFQELSEHVLPETATHWRVQCWSRLGASARLPMAELLQRLLAPSPEGPPPRHPRALEARLDASGLPEEDTLPLRLLLELPVPEDAPVHRLTRERRQEKTYEALVELLLREASRRPVLLAVEDLHWADSSWLAFLSLLLERLEAAPLLVVLSARPEFQPSWPSRPWFHPLTLERLPAGLAVTLVREAARGAPLPEETVGALVEKTDGVPLFIEEMTRMVVEGGQLASIPVTLHELLLARLDLLPSRQKHLAQLGAVVGRDFSLALLAAVTEREPADLRRALAGLMEAGLLQAERGETDEPGYQFRHALFQEAAYQSLPRGERRRHHRRIAQVLEERFTEVVEARPEVLAHHHSEASAPERALPYWQQAGRLAVQQLAIPEAMSYHTRSLEALRSLPEAQRRSGEELVVLTALGFSQALLWGYDSPEVARTFSQVRALLGRTDVHPHELEDAIWCVFTYHEARAEFPQCHEVAELLEREGERHRSPLLLAASECMRAVAHCYEGHARSALESTERAVAHARSNEGPYREEQLASVLACGSSIRSVSGQWARARADDREALELVQRSGEPFMVRMVMTYTALDCQTRREATAALHWADESLAISSERGPWLWPVWARVIRGWALAELGRPQEGLALLQRELDRWREHGMRGGRTYCLGMLAEVHLGLGQVREGLSAVHEALELARATGEHGNEAELYRLRGELLRAGRQEGEARSDFLRALAIAREQGALLYELRASVSLGRLLRDTGHPETARRLLTRLLTRLDVGEDLVDLAEARALLEQPPPSQWR